MATNADTTKTTTTPKQRTPKAKVSTTKPVVEAVEKAADTTVDMTADALRMAELAAETAERNLDSLMEGNNKFVPWIKRGPWAVVLVGGVGLAIGAGITYYVTRKRTIAKYDALAQEEIAKAKALYGKIYKTDKENASPEAVVQRIHGGEKAATEAVQEYSGEVVPEAEDLQQSATATPVRKTKRPLEQKLVSPPLDTSTGLIPGDEWNYDLEKAVRTPAKPYIIHHDEYYNNETDYEQIPLTYYEGDDVVVDEREQPLPDQDDTVGDDNLSLFGHGSKDINMLYVRNDRIEADFEIVRHSGRYAQDVLGFTDDVQEEITKHSKDPNPFVRQDHGGSKRKKSRKARRHDG